MDNKQWHRWFAWHPVRLNDGRRAWWEYIERTWDPNTNLRCIHPDDPGEYEGDWEYRAITPTGLVIYDSKGRAYTEDQIAMLMDAELIEALQVLAKLGIPEDSYPPDEDGLEEGCNDYFIQYADIRKARAVLRHLIK